MSDERDRALLRRFEPIIRYTRGERFFPVDIEPYVHASSLWVQRLGQEAVCLVPQGELTLEKLAQPRAEGVAVTCFLKFIEPLDIRRLVEFRRQKRRERKNVFRPGHGRLARVGYGSRFVDLLFSLTLLARGRVPGDTGAAAALEYGRLLDEDERYCYYGRVVREQGWIVLQYWFFYAFNNWRSGFFGVNDHEADWEMINVYLSETPEGEVSPQWVAYAAHDFYGDDLRRRWDDPELEKVGDHPVIYAGAGSHAGYYSPGEYLTELELPFLSPLIRLTDQVQALWKKTMRQELDEGQVLSKEVGLNVFRVPFVDYARGDGLSIGPGQGLEWDASSLLDPVPGWVIHYRGLWGLYARDPISGENAPAGPMYNRDGSVRRAWYDPLGWAGLDKVAPPAVAWARLRERQERILVRREELDEAILQKSKELVGLSVESAAMQDRSHLKALGATHREKIKALSEKVRRLRAQRATDGTLLEALNLYQVQLEAGERGPMRAHIRRAHHPASDDDLRASRAAELWAAISVGLMMIGFVLLILLDRQNLISGLIAVVSLFVFIESGFRRRLSQLVNSVAIGLALISVLVILFEFFWPIVVLGVLVAGGYIIWENLRELSFQSYPRTKR